MSRIDPSKGAEAKVEFDKGTKACVWTVVVVVVVVSHPPPSPGAHPPPTPQHHHLAHQVESGLAVQ